MELIEIKCQICGEIFSVKAKPRKIICPGCGLMGYLKGSDK